MPSREPVHTHARPVRPKTKLGERKRMAKERIHAQRWLGGIDPMNIVIGSSVLLTPVLGAGMILIGVLVIALILVVILW